MTVRATLPLTSKPASSSLARTLPNGSSGPATRNARRTSAAAADWMGKYPLKVLTATRPQGQHLAMAAVEIAQRLNNSSLRHRASKARRYIFENRGRTLIIEINTIFDELPEQWV